MPWVRESKGVRDSRAEEDAVEQEVCACAEEDAKEQVCVAVTGTSGRHEREDTHLPKAALAIED